MITMAEIARLTGVSQPTVSRVLNGNKAVNPEIREKVLACAREHDFQPNVMAQSLVGSRTKLIGVIVTDIGNAFFADLVKYIDVGATYYFNRNMSTYVDYKINLLDDNDSFYKDNGISTDNIVALGLVYQF